MQWKIKNVSCTLREHYVHEELILFHEHKHRSTDTTKNPYPSESDLIRELRWSEGFLRIARGHSETLNQAAFIQFLRPVRNVDLTPIANVWDIISGIVVKEAGRPFGNLTTTITKNPLKRNFTPFYVVRASLYRKSFILRDASYQFPFANVGFRLLHPILFANANALL